MTMNGKLNPLPINACYYLPTAVSHKGKIGTYNIILVEPQPLELLRQHKIRRHLDRHLEISHAQ